MYTLRNCKLVLPPMHILASGPLQQKNEYEVDIYMERIYFIKIYHKHL